MIFFLCQINLDGYLLKLNLNNKIGINNDTNKITFNKNNKIDINAYLSMIGN
jgi:hypothetical protein